MSSSQSPPHLPREPRAPITSPSNSVSFSYTAFIYLFVCLFILSHSGPLELPVRVCVLEIIIHRGWWGDSPVATLLRKSASPSSTLSVSQGTSMRIPHMDNT